MSFVKSWDSQLGKLEHSDLADVGIIDIITGGQHGNLGSWNHSNFAAVGITDIITGGVDMGSTLDTATTTGFTTTLTQGKNEHNNEDQEIYYCLLPAKRQKEV